jgi:hypothetical protein
MKTNVLFLFIDKPTKADITLPDNNIAFLGDELTIKCASDGLPKPSYTITHNGTEVSDKATYNKSETVWDDAGTYVCIAKNKLGTINSSSAILIVKGR